MELSLRVSLKCATLTSYERVMRYIFTKRRIPSRFTLVYLHRPSRPIILDHLVSQPLFSYLDRRNEMIISARLNGVTKGNVEAERKKRR